MRCLFICILLVLLISVKSFNLFASSTFIRRHVRLQQSTFESDIIPDVVDSSGVDSTVHATATTTTTTSTSSTALPYLENRRPLKTALLALAARTGRGEIASQNEISKGLDLVSQLESFNPVESPANNDEYILGTWELVWCSTYLFRSSPFFMAARAVCEDGQQAETFNTFCKLHREALAFTQIGKVRQIITPTTIVSEFETNVAVVPGLPIIVKGVIESSADIVSRNSNEWELFMDKVKIKKGTSNIPVLNNLLDDFAGLPTRTLSDLLDQAFSLKAPRPKVFHTYVDTHMRISRDQDDNVFVYNRLE